MFNPNLLASVDYKNVRLIINACNQLSTAAIAKN